MYTFPIIFHFLPTLIVKMLHTYYKNSRLTKGIKIIFKIKVQMESHHSEMTCHW